MSSGGITWREVLELAKIHTDEYPEVMDATVNMQDENGAWVESVVIDVDLANGELWIIVEDRGT